jgi:superfamily II DNA or RNA helicase/HKD family nuclease
VFSQTDFQDGILSGFAEYNPDSSDLYQPRLVLNDYSRGLKTLEFILDNIKNCHTFQIAVAFVTRSGVACLHQTLKEFCERGGKGQILVSSYLSFSEPLAIRTLTEFSGLTISFVNEPNFHGKTYLFEHENYAQILIGSSNLTQDALGKNTEVNLGIYLLRESGLYKKTSLEIGRWIENSELVTEENLASYTESWELARTTNTESKHNSILHYPHAPYTTDLNKPDSNPIIPNELQVPALHRLKNIRNSGESRSLVISATGTGKTVLAALDAKQFGAKKLLFVVHRLNIAKKALSEFKRVFGTSKSMGIYSAGETLNKSAEFIFSTVQTINTDRHLVNFLPTEFDYIIIDETHRAGATTYKRILDYFKPKFLLGMTATPERTDGFDIFSLFNHSVAYEIRLKKAMEAELLTPFHYFGVTEITVDGHTIDEMTDFTKLTSTERVNHIIKKIREYGCSSNEIRGLVFCSKVDEATQLSIEFNKRNFKSIALSGSDSEETRETAIRRLESTDEDKLDYIFTVDIFNEGVDIPMVNQVVMLRPTSSSIIFVQQLGRGLRKAPNKEYVTVIDFIGNYQNNYNIPIALFGDSSYNKDRLRRLLSAGSSLIPGASTISFDKIARDRIFKSIDTANFNTKKHLINDFELLKFRLGRTPYMIDFIENESRDPYQYVDYSGSYLAFLLSINEAAPKSENSVKLLGYLSKHVCDGARLEEGVILELLLQNYEISFNDVKVRVLQTANYTTSDTTINSAIHNLNLHFITERNAGQNLRVSEFSGIQTISFIKNEQIIRRGKSLIEALNDEDVISYLFDIVNTSNHRFLEDYKEEDFVGGFKRFGKYSRKQVFRILNWDKLPNAQNVGGYVISPDDSNCPIFLTYNKKDDISQTTKYEDRFINPGHVVYMSKNRRRLTSPDVRSMIEHTITGMRIPFFVKKSDDEGLDFYYLGELTAIPEKFVESTMSDTDDNEVSVVKMEYLLDKSIDYRLYRYITESQSTV